MERDEIRAPLKRPAWETNENQAKFHMVFYR